MLAHNRWIQIWWQKLSFPWKLFVEFRASHIDIGPIYVGCVSNCQAILTK